jgi:hypothetical protein
MFDFFIFVRILWYGNVRYAKLLFFVSFLFRTPIATRFNLNEHQEKMPKRNGGGGGGGQAAKVREDPLYAQVRQLKQQKNQAKKAQYKKYGPHDLI